MSTSFNVYSSNVPAIGVTLPDPVNQQLYWLTANARFGSLKKPEPGQIPVFTTATQHPDRFAFGVVAQLNVSGIEFAAKDQCHGR